MQQAAIAGKAAKYDARHIRRSSQRLSDRGDRDAGRTIGGKAINAGGNGGKGYGEKCVGLAQFERAAIAGSEQLVFARVAAVPNRTDGVNHIPGRKAIAFGDFSVAGGAATKRAAFGKQLGTGGPMNRTIDAATTEQRRIGGVDDGVNAQCRDIGNDDFEPRLADLARRAAQA